MRDTHIRINGGKKAVNLNNNLLLNTIQNIKKCTQLQMSLPEVIANTVYKYSLMGIILPHL